MNLSECPGCGLPREGETAAKVCPLCGYDPAKPAPVVPEPAPKPAAKAEPAPNEPAPPSGGRAMLLLTLAVLILGGGGAFVFWPKPEPKPDDKGDTAKAAKPDPQPPVVPPAPKPKPPDVIPPKVTPPDAPLPPIKWIETAPDPRPFVKGAPPKPRAGTFTAPLLPADAIRIDGNLADWKDIPHLTLTVNQRGKPTKKVATAPKTQKAFVAYCPKGLLVAAEVVDTSGELENVPKPDKGAWGFWDNDALEVFIDTINSRDPDRGALHHHQFFAFPFGTKSDDGARGYESKIIRTAWTIAPLKGAAVMERAGRKTDTGWTIEMLIPYAALRQNEVKPGAKIGFELQLDTGTNVYYFWACDDPNLRVSMHPHAWGEVLLAGADAKLELLGTDGRPSAKAVPGAPLTVYLTDPDLALDPAKPLPSVTVRTRAGAERTIALRETAPASGVYVGTIATKPAPGLRAANLLELATGDTVAVEYVEPLRASGDRDRVLRAEFSTK